MENNMEQNIPEQSLESETKSGAGALIGSIIIIIILIAGAIYFFSSLKNAEAPTVPDENNSEVFNNENIEEIEADVDAALDIDIEDALKDIDAEIDAAASA